MKKIIVKTLYAFFLVSLAGTVAQAQHTGYASASQSRDDVYSDNIEKYFRVDSSLEIPVSTVNTKVLKHFTRSFDKADHVRWYKAEDGTIAFFMQYGIISRANYDKKGNWLHNIRSYNEQNLPRDVRAQVKSIYYDYSISSVNDITTASQLIYVIQVEDEKTWKNLRLENGEMKMINEYLKKGKK